jgi:hypothetical protein
MNNTKHIIFVVIALVILSCIHYFFSVNNGYTTTISTADYSGHGGETYMVKEYRVENGCVIFKDMMGVERRICGEYYVNDYSQIFK